MKRSDLNAALDGCPEIRLVFTVISVPRHTKHVGLKLGDLVYLTAERQYMGLLRGADAVTYNLRKEDKWIGVGLRAHHIEFSGYELHYPNSGNVYHTSLTGI